MAFDPIPTPASIGKKKRVNRTAKLKQSKLDVRREQWLNQVKNRGLGLGFGFKEERIGTGGVKLAAAETRAASGASDRELAMVSLEVSVGGEESEGLMSRYSDSESPSNSPNFTGSSNSSSSGSSRRGRGGCFSRSVTDEDEDDRNNDEDEDDDCFDDWEAMADALAADDDQKNQEAETATEPKPEPERTGCEPQKAQRAVDGYRAWRPDDISRPQNLPNLLKQRTFPMKSVSLLHHGVGYAPSSCPICCEDLDMTDTSFLPCPCGYRLCLFCHKRILEDNGRCPGCRKPYEHDHEHDQTDLKAAHFKFTRSYSVNPMR